MVIYHGYYDRKTVVDHIDLEIYEGEIYGLLGPNGAGKSTTMNMICSLIPSSNGNSLFFVSGSTVAYGDFTKRKKFLIK